MEIYVKAVKDLLNEDLSLSQRGILITLLLIKDENAKFTLSKFKALVSLNQIKEDLIYLQDRGYIKWSGYSAAKKQSKADKLTPEVIEAMEFLNSLYKRKFDPATEAYNKPLRARLAEYSLEEVKIVIANRYAEWKDDPMMKKHLTPTTLFRAKHFKKYLDDAKYTGTGSSFVSADKIDLKYGDIITSEVAKSLADEDVYDIKIYNTDDEGNVRGSGVKAKRYGHQIKVMEKIQERLVTNGSKREYIYKYAHR